MTIQLILEGIEEIAAQAYLDHSLDSGGMCMQASMAISLKRIANALEEQLKIARIEKPLAKPGEKC